MPERTCVCCRKKGEKEELFRIASEDQNYVFDEKMMVQSRGFYICKDVVCLEKISKHRKYNISAELILEMAKKVVNKKKSVIDILRPMINSEYFIFGVDNNLEGVKKGKVKLLIIPRDIKEKYINDFKKLAKENKASIIFIKEQRELLKLFNRDVKIIGVYDKKVINGILNKVEVTDEDIRIG